MTDLRVAHVDDNLSWRGGERQVLALMEGLAAENMRNILVCRHRSELERRAVERGIEVHTLPLAGEWDFVSAMKLRSIVRREGIRIVHAHTSHSHTIALIALMGNRDCRLVVSRRVDFHLHTLFSRLIKYGSGADRIIAVSDAIRNVLIEDGVDPAKITTVRSGFVPGEFLESPARDIRSEIGISPDTAVIATVAALAPHKAHWVLLKAAHLVLKKHPDVRFLLAGEGGMRPEIERDIRNLGIERSVVLLGFVSDIGAVYRAADIFAISSNEEGLCSSILDAMHFSLPVVATKAGGIPELVQDGVNGFIVPVNDYRSFADRLNTLIENIELRKRMGIRSVPVLAENSIRFTVAKTLEVYRELTGVPEGDRNE
jgi:L-malate glycosyltransferase